MRTYIHIYFVFYIYRRRARYACSRYASCYSLYICTRAFGPRYGRKLPLTIEIKETYVTTKRICHVMLALIKLESVPITSNSPSKNCRFWDNSVLVYILVVNNNKYLSHVVDIIKIGISVPDYPSSNVEITFLVQFCICLHLSGKQQQIFIICC